MTALHTASTIGGSVFEDSARTELRESSAIEHQSILLSDEFLEPMETFLQKPIRRLSAHVDGEIAAGFSGALVHTARGQALRRILHVPWHALVGRGRTEPLDSRGAACAFDELSEQIQRDFVSASFDLHPALQDVRHMQWAGWNVDIRYTFQTDLKTWGPGVVDSSVRRRARRAATQGVEICHDVSPQDFALLWCRTQKSPACPKMTELLLKTLRERQIVQLWGAFLPNGQLAACTSILFDGQIAYYWLAAFDRHEPHHGASNQLLHMEILRALRQAAETFDWVGANTPSIARYKASFGPKLVDHFRVHWKSPAPPRATRGWKSWLRSCPLLGKACAP